MGNQVRYRANRDNIVYEPLAEIFRRTLGLADVIRDALNPLSDKIDLAFVFGSVAQGKERPTSDVDVFVIGAASFESVVQVFAAMQARLGRGVNPVAMPKRLLRETQGRQSLYFAHCARTKNFPDWN